MASVAQFLKFFEVFQESTLKTSFTSESALRWNVSGAGHVLHEAGQTRVQKC
jgi:hypothetical protein